MAHRRLAIFRRRVFTVLSVPSLLLCVATVALWVRSYWQRDAIFHRFEDSNLSLHMHTALSQSGEIAVAASVHSFPRDRPSLGWRYASQSVSAVNMYLNQFDSNAGGFGLVFGFGFRSIIASGITYRATAFPHWSLVLILRHPARAATPRDHRLAPSSPLRPLPALRLRPARHARAMPGMRAHRRDAVNTEKCSSTKMHTDGHG